MVVEEVRVIVAIEIPTIEIVRLVFIFKDELCTQQKYSLYLI